MAEYWIVFSKNGERFKAGVSCSMLVYPFGLFSGMIFFRNYMYKSAKCSIINSISLQKFINWVMVNIPICFIFLLNKRIFHFKMLPKKCFLNVVLIHVSWILHLFKKVNLCLLERLTICLLGDSHPDVRLAADDPFPSFYPHHRLKNNLNHRPAGGRLRTAIKIGVS